MGRHAGWMAASSALARTKKDDAPHIILLPEIIFDEKKFLLEVKSIIKKKGFCVIVVSEGVKNNKGKFLGNVSAVFDYGSDPLLEIGKELVVFNNDNFPLVKIKEKKNNSKYDFFGDIQND